ncbi:hypothetical protein DB346_10785 [Verrucomicrobia bacterium LW23]|nr:hypothetical protein DB346_10785 [Verrucomicrobia bacterium LW23]
MPKQLFLILTLLVGLTFAAGCSKSSDPSTIKIGLAGVQTGNDAMLGKSMVEGSAIALDEWNAKGGILGKKLEAISVDDEGNSEKAVNVANDLVAKGVVAVLGHFNSSCTIPTMRIYNESKILQITPGSTNTKITQEGIPTLFRVVGRDAQQAEVNVNYLFDTLGLRKLAVIHNSTSWGEGIAKEVADLWKKKGGEVVEFSGINEADRDFSANIATIKSKGAQALFGGLMYAQSGPLINKMRKDGLEIPFAGGDGSFDPALITAAGDYATNVFLTFGPDMESKPEARPFYEKYRARYGREPGPYAIYGYAAAQVLLTAMEKAASTDAAKVAEVMHKDTFQTAMGEIAFDEKGDLRKTYFVIWTVKDKKFVVLQQ